jgi:beta-glucosidase
MEPSVALDSSLSARTWQDPDLPTAARVADLMSRMTVREKLAQLYGVWLHVDETDGEVAPHQDDQAAQAVDWQEIVGYGIGQVTRAYGTVPVEPDEGARRLAALQRQIMAAGRFGLPALVHEETLTGLAIWQAPIYPSPLCWGASFDPQLIEQLGAQIGHTARRLGVHQGLAPVLDVVRDLRWGRVEETIGEDPYLVGIIGSAYVRGLQSAGIVATLKHFAGYAASRAGRNHAPVPIGPRELADVVLPPFEMALAAGAGSVMHSYVDLDGLPAAADDGLLTTRLREMYGFTGTVVSDYFAVAFLKDSHAVAATRGEAAGLALSAGVDVELPAVNCYGEPLLAEVESGRVDIALVDRALERVLTQKCELGLLDADWSPEPAVLREDAPVVLDDAPSRALARRLAARSVVLLRNEPVVPAPGRPAGSPPDGAPAGDAPATGAPLLPLRPGQRVAVVGPNAHESAAMLGCYSFPRHVGVHHPDLPDGVAIPSLVDALRADEAGYDVRYARGCPVLGGDDEGIAEAVRTARDADVCVVALGDLAALFGLGTSGEGCDAADLRLPGRQEELLDAVLATGTPVVLVLLVGRPYELSRQVDRLAAVVCGFFPGEEGAPALADVLSGRVNPSGRLPVSFPNAGANQPSTYLAGRLAQRTDVSTVDPTPLFPFGHGLSYAPATWLEVARHSPATWPTDGTCELRVSLRNDTATPTTEVVQVYLHDPVAEVVRPVQQLIAAVRVELAAGAAQTVRIGLHADLTAYTGRAGCRLVDAGDIELRVGASSADIRGAVCVTLTGPRREVGFDRVRLPEVTLLPAG